MTVILRNTALTFQNSLLGFDLFKVKTAAIRGLLDNGCSCDPMEHSGEIYESKIKFHLEYNSLFKCPKINNYKLKSGELISADENKSQKKRELLVGNFSALIASPLISINKLLRLFDQIISYGQPIKVNFKHPVTKEKPTTKASAEKSWAGVILAPVPSFLTAK
ncbi:hypothetical protein QWY93_10040 [Echinicola jeungdonensis]|uniref:Uncharacterized protein n=1 Tax=Echinicola jeungdonensis TaxID=709343 RepID=A0ABV5J9N7_9BACT|nr:hypothetical protein [Echinicola jeungdonensis]MDN3669665.1 hypothetical protein [Echinicola jeungdonensis]